MKEKKYIVFDVDGTLLDTEFIWGKIWKMVGMKYGHPSFCHDEVVGISGAALRAVMDRQLEGVPEEEKEEMLNEARRIGLSYIKEHTALMPGVMEMFAWLKEQGFTLCIATTTERSLTEERLKRNGIWEDVSFSICGDEVERKKPNPEIYQKMARLLDAEAEEMLVIEDTGFGVEAAWLAGCEVIMIPSVNPASEKDRKMALRIEKDMYEALNWMKENIRRKG